ncbi:MAG: methyltransferase domain-containing protein [Candidatus Woesearchaeota archaeon]
MTNKIKEYWDEISKEYQEECNIPIGIHYGNGAPFEDELHLLGDLNGKRVLEIGCGGAQCGIAMAQQGARVIGIDISTEQLTFARELARRNGVDIKLYQGDIIEIPQVRSHSQDLVFSAWSLLYVDNLGSCLSEVYRVLKKKGIFVASMPHPVLRIVDPDSLVMKEGYFDVGKFEQEELRKDGSTRKLVAYHHTISELFDGFTTAGFSIETIIEPDPRAYRKRDPWYGKWDCTSELSNYIPLTMIFKVRKE